MVRIKYKFYYHPGDLVRKKEKSKSSAKQYLEKKSDTDDPPVITSFIGSSKAKEKWREAILFLAYCGKLSQLLVIRFKYTSLWKCCLFFQNKELTLYESTPETFLTMLFTFQ